MNKIIFLFLILFSLSAGALFLTSPLIVSPCQSGVTYDFNLSQPSFLSTDIAFPHFLPSFLNGNGSFVFDVPCNTSPGVYQFSLNSSNGYYNDSQTTQVFVSSNSSIINVLNPAVSCVCSSSRSFIQGNQSVTVQTPFQYWLSPDNSVLIQNIPCDAQTGLYLFRVFSNSKEEYDYALNVVQCGNVVLKTPSFATACTGVFSTTFTLQNNQNSENVFTLTSSIGSVLSPIDLAPFASRSFIFSSFFDAPGVYPVQVNVSGSNGFNSQSNFVVNVSSCAPRFLNLTVSGVLVNGQANISITNNEKFDVTSAVFQVNKTISKAVAIPSQKSVTLYFPFNSSTLFISGSSAQGVFNQTVLLSKQSSLLSGFVVALPYAGGLLILIIIIVAFYFFSRRHDKTDDELFEETLKSVES